MRKYRSALAIAFALATSVAASVVYAQTRGNSMMGHGMIGSGGGMMNMMNHCSNMMQSARPNDQWRQQTPPAPEKKG